MLRSTPKTLSVIWALTRTFAENKSLQSATLKGALRDDTKNGCVADYIYGLLGELWLIGTLRSDNGDDRENVTKK